MLKEERHMEKYKVILVDDEIEAIQAMEHKMDWDGLGFEVSGSATNGVKALELVENIQPDVVITDIKMPYMNGLELAQKLNNDYPNIHIIIFTGFDEFEYAKEAVHLEIEEYMLKPVNQICVEKGHFFAYSIIIQRTATGIVKRKAWFQRNDYYRCHQYGRLWLCRKT